MMKESCLNKQRGNVIVLTTIAIPVLLFAAGWALDFGHAFVDKTRLQNALDAAAISAAITINKDPTKNLGAATTAGNLTYTLFVDAASPGNNELAAANLTLTFAYSKYSTGPFDNNITSSDPFAFVRVTSTDINVETTFLKVIWPSDKDIVIPAVATAGPVGQNCGVAPILLCADMDAPGPPGSGDPTDTTAFDEDCGDGACYGYTIGEQFNAIQSDCYADSGINAYASNATSSRGFTPLSTIIDFLVASATAAPGGNSNSSSGSSNSSSGNSNSSSGGGSNPCNVVNGNFNWVNPDGTHGGGVPELVDAISGTADTCPPISNTLLTATGLMFNPIVSAIIERYELDTDQGPNTYTAYTGNKKRVLPVILGNCLGTEHGNEVLEKVGTACLFLPEKPDSNDPSHELIVEFVGDSCGLTETWDPTNPVLNAFYKIVLFRSQTAPGDS